MFKLSAFDGVAVASFELEFPSGCPLLDPYSIAGFEVGSVSHDELGMDG